jgi:hypothetical protein
MKIYLDDLRPTPQGWIRTYTAKETINLLKTGTIEEISLDHDLGDEETQGTGYDVILWLEEQIFLDNIKPPLIKVHSANISARIKMELAIQSINKFKTSNTL